MNRPAFFPLPAAVAISVACLSASSGAAQPDAAAKFGQAIKPILVEFCYGCHGDGSAEGGVQFDKFASDAALAADRQLWWRALKMVRAGLMPPAGESRPSPQQVKRLEEWIKHSAFAIDPANPDPGRVVVRRLNRVEYKNTIRDLMGVDYNVQAEFPADDAGHGFDNLGEVLTLSPLLLEKYFTAAKSIVTEAVPTVPKVVPEQRVAGNCFREADSAADSTTEAEPASAAQTPRREGPLSLSYYEPAKVAHTVTIEHAGRYQVVLDMTANERYVENRFDYNKCRLVLKADGEELLRQDYAREGGKPFHYEFDRDWQPGEHALSIEVEPLTRDVQQIRSLNFRIVAVTVRGPFEARYWVRPKNYERFFPKETPESKEGRRAYARELLGDFATRAFRRPVDDETLDRLVELAESVSGQEGATFESGIAQAMTAVLVSPRLLFREEGTVSGENGSAHPLVDEYALASRLSYFLWSTMPDEELFRLARENKLRVQLPAQVKRMLADPRAEALSQNFVGQWLQARDVDTVPINAFAVMRREQSPVDRGAGGRGGRGFGRGRGRFGRGFALTPDLRQAMRRETELLFSHVLREDRPLTELIDSNYTFVNERLATHYGMEGIEGDEMRQVSFPADSPRGGVLTHGSVLIVTSNPDRTSPVKRGLFILENVLGIPPAPPPPDLPTLEDAEESITDREPTLREVLALHRSDAACSSCHNRMDPLGLALENFNALGRWRDKERDQPIDVAGQLITGESFTNVRELKRILANERRQDVYRCLTEKMLTYALGRGLDYYDVYAVDTIVEELEKENGRPSALLIGIVQSTPFQKTRRADVLVAVEP